MLDGATIFGGPMMGDATSGAVTWVDLSTPDIGGAQRFYAELLGWELGVRRTPMGEYTVASSRGREVAGMMAQAPDVAGMPATWTVFVVVDDMEAALTRVTGSRGEVRQPPFEIPGGALREVTRERAAHWSSSCSSSSTAS